MVSPQAKRKAVTMLMYAFEKEGDSRSSSETLHRLAFRIRRATPELIA